jgi:hypothetical protein
MSNIKKHKASLINRLFEGFFVGLGIGIGLVFMQLLSQNTIENIELILNYVGM